MILLFPMHARVAEVQVVRFELTSRYSLLEQNIQLFIGATFGLWESKVRPRQHEQSTNRARKRRFTLKVALGCVQHVWRAHGVDDAEEVVGVPPERNSLNTKPTRSDLCSYRVGDRANSQTVREEPDQQHCGLRPQKARGTGSESHEANRKHQRCHGAQSTHVYGSSAHVLLQNP